MSRRAHSPTTLGVWLLWIGCLLFVGFGLAAVSYPRELAKFIVGDAPSAPSAVIDMRATYGGFAIGVGAFFGLCARKTQWLRPGLLASLLAVAGIGVARAVGIVVDGDPNVFMWFLLATEVVFVTLVAIALRQIRAQDRYDD